LRIEVRGHPRYTRTHEKLRDDWIIKEIDKALDEFKSDISKGDYDKNKPYPSRYRKDGVKHLYIYNIQSYRLIYTISRDALTKTYLVLDFLTHNEYDEIFNYHTS